MGYRFGDFAYVCDIKSYDDTIFEALHGINHLVISAIGTKPTLSHLSLDDAIAFASKVGVKNTYITHIAHELDHNEVSKVLPEGIVLGYDGMEVSFDYDK